MATISELRKECGLTQQQFADAIGKGVGTVKKWEGGIRQPSTEEFPKIAEVLRCGVTDISLPPKRCGQTMTAIGKIRRERGLTLRQFATAVGRGHSTIQDWENGISRPSDEVFPKIAEVLGCNVEDIYIPSRYEGRAVTAIGKIREERGMTQQQLATAVGKEARAVRRWEEGTYRPSDAEFAKLAKALGCDIADIWIPPKTQSERRVRSAEEKAAEAANKEKVAPYIERRIALGLTKRELAKRARVHLQTINDMEAGRKFPMWETRQKIRCALGMPEERYCSIEERNAIFLDLYEEGIIESVIRRNYSSLHAVHADLDDLKQELAICALLAIERCDPEGPAPVRAFVYTSMNFCAKRRIYKTTMHGMSGTVEFPLPNISFVSLDALRESGFDIEG